MSEPPVNVVTPADVLRRVTTMGVVANIVTLWSYLWARFAEDYPERRAGVGAAELRIDEDTLAGWLDDFVDTAETQRGKLVRHLNPGSRK